MLAIIRLLLMGLYFIGTTFVLLLLLLLRPFHINNVYFVAQTYGAFLKILGVELEIRGHEYKAEDKPTVYIANHQNTYEIFTASNGVCRNTVSVGKKNLKWIPFFGIVYWLSGNILIDRGNRAKAHSTINQAAEKIKEKGLSIWLFPEGTRSYGREMLRFKTGAFYTAAKAGVPIVPTVISNTHELINLNRWNNGKIIIEYMPEMILESEDKAYIREVANQAHGIMLAKFNELNKELGVELDTSKATKA